MIPPLFSATMPRRHTGKRYRRGKHFSPPTLSIELPEGHYFGVITKYHGGHLKQMDVTAWDSDAEKLIQTKCVLRGAIRHRKCQQQIRIGAYCQIADGRVEMILTEEQCKEIPRDQYSTLQRVCVEFQEEDTVEFEALDKHESDMFELSSESESESEDDI